MITSPFAQNMGLQLMPRNGRNPLQNQQVLQQQLLRNAQQVRQQAPNPQVYARATAWTFADHIHAFGLPPLLRVSDQKIIAGPFLVKVTITDNAVVSLDLCDLSLWDKRVQSLYGSASSVKPKAILHWTGFSILANDVNLRAETTTLRQNLDDRLYLSVTRNTQNQQFNAREHIFERGDQFEFHEATNSLTERQFWNVERPWFFERPFRIDLETDSFLAKVDTAINWASTDIVTYAKLYGALAPKDTIGAGGIADNACSDDGFIEDQQGALTAVGPLTYKALSGLAGSWRQAAIANIR